MADWQHRLMREVDAKDALRFFGIARRERCENLAMLAQRSRAGLPPAVEILGVAVNQRQWGAVVQIRQAPHPR